MMIRIYSVGVWNKFTSAETAEPLPLEFTPLEFETVCAVVPAGATYKLEFTPLEFETCGYSPLCLFSQN